MQVQFGRKNKNAELTRKNYKRKDTGATNLYTLSLFDEECKRTTRLIECVGTLLDQANNVTMLILTMYCCMVFLGKGPKFQPIKSEITVFPHSWLQF